MERMKVAVLLTCHNRKDKTINCINGLSLNAVDQCFVVVDDGSTDGTVEALKEMENVTVIEGDGNLFYSGGMRNGMEFARDNIEADYYVLVNDDVSFDKGVLERLVSVSGDRVYVGAMRNAAGECSYGGVRYTDGIHYKKVTPEDADRGCDTFNANFVAIPSEIFKTVPLMDNHYRHGLGDFDYGLSIKRAGYQIEVMREYAGVCENNSSAGTWMDRSLSRGERFKKKESVKGAPFEQWFYFLKKNFGLGRAIVSSLTPYVRILLGK